jgi:hypothetical protein
VITNFAQHAREYANSVKARESSLLVFGGSVVAMAFGAAVAGFSGGTLAWLGGGVAVGGAIVAVGSGLQFIEAGASMGESKKATKLYFDALKPFSGLDPLNMDDLPPLLPFPFNQ